MVKPETKAYNTFADLVKNWMRDGEDKRGMPQRIHNVIAICQTHIAKQEEVEYYTALQAILKRFLVVVS